MNPHFPPPHTGQPASEKSPGTKAFQSWRWVFLAAILITITATAALYIGNVQAQSSRGAITGLTLASTTAGTLTVSWDAASPTPTDYRVDWAKSTEDYKSWKVDDGHVYTAETATTTTITDLSHDTDYKIRMRARYYKGEHMGKSWGGPWATATITVAGEPAETVQQPPKEDPVQKPAKNDPDPPAGTIETLTAADDTGQLLLTWEAPAAPNDTPTDYHINWAKSNEDYPADTASAGNAHPTTTTHTLAGLEYDTDYNIRIRARYTDGDAAASPWNGPWTETTAQVKLPLPAAPIMGSTAVTPDGDVFLSWFNTAQNDSITGYQILRGPKADSLVIIEDDTGSNGNSYTDTAPPAGQTHTYAVKARNASGLGPQSDTATATVPEAEKEEELTTARHESGENTLVSNLDQAVHTVNLIGSSVNPTAQEFTTGNYPTGYHVTEVHLYLKKFDATTATVDPVVTIQSDNSGNPDGTVLSTFTAASPVTDTGYQLFTFTTEDQPRLLPNTGYWLQVAGSTTVEMLIQSTASDAEDPDSQPSWEIGDEAYFLDVARWTTLTDNNIRLEIRGHEYNGETFVSNLGQGHADWREAHAGSPTTKYAQLFRTGDDEHGYLVTNVEFLGRRRTGADAPDPRVTINAVSGTSPGAVLYELTPHPDNSLAAASSTTGSRHRFILPQGTILERNRDYFIVLDASSGGFQVSSTGSGTEDAGNDPSWSMPSNGVSSDSRHAGGAWRDVPNFIVRLAIRGEALPTTDEHAGLDFPGADHNAHKTLGYVTPGIVSTGHLTPGLDRNHGLTGDFWRLDTQWGHSYRIEVKFGDNPSNNTGGSAWGYFIDGDRRGTCCESDHNRNDGYTILHIKHDRNREYLIEVAVFDKLNAGSRNYNGPYTITMTDITGTDKLVSNLYIGTLSELASPVGTERQYALDFTTGRNTGGYKLDRIRTHIPDGYTRPVLTLHTGTFTAPGAKLCDFRNPTQVQHHLYWEDFPAPVPFLAPDCADVILVASTRYWIVFAGTGYTPVVTDFDGELPNRSSWFMGNISVTKTTGSWSDISGNPAIAAEIWASPR